LGVLHMIRVLVHRMWYTTLNDTHNHRSIDAPSPYVCTLVRSSLERATLTPLSLLSLLSALYYVLTSHSRQKSDVNVSDRNLKHLCDISTSAYSTVISRLSPHVDPDWGMRT
jgi:hypothetical protein